MPGPSVRSPTCQTTMVVGVLFVAAMFAAAPSLAAPQMANPASQNCEAKGGKLEMEKNQQGAQYGVCVFDDNRQCEEWAMLRGECPDGGIHVMGYATPAARYCAITGGTYTVTGASNTSNEQGNCTLPNGLKCTAESYYDGSCAKAGSKNPPTGGAATSAQRISAKFLCANGKFINTTFINDKGGRVQLAFSDGRNMTLPQAPSADGGRYANQDGSIVFWNKGKTAVVRENGKITYTNCVTK